MLLCGSYSGEGRAAGGLRRGADRSADGSHAAAARHLRRHLVPQQTTQAAGLAHDYPPEPLQRQDQYEGKVRLAKISYSICMVNLSVLYLLRAPLFLAVWNNIFLTVQLL